MNALKIILTIIGLVILLPILIVIIAALGAGAIAPVFMFVGFIAFALRK